MGGGLYRYSRLPFVGFVAPLVLANVVVGGQACATTLHEIVGTAAGKSEIALGFRSTTTREASSRTMRWPLFFLYIDTSRRRKMGVCVAFFFVSPVLICFRFLFRALFCLKAAGDAPAIAHYARGTAPPGLHAVIVSFSFFLSFYRKKNETTGSALSLFVVVLSLQVIETRKFALTPGLTPKELVQEAEMLKRVDHEYIIKLEDIFQVRDMRAPCVLRHALTWVLSDLDNDCIAMPWGCRHFILRVCGEAWEVPAVSLQ